MYAKNINEVSFFLSALTILYPEAFKLNLLSRLSSEKHMQKPLQRTKLLQGKRSITTTRVAPMKLTLLGFSFFVPQSFEL